MLPTSEAGSGSERPSRLVEMSDPEWLLVIGGAPARAIETAFEARVESAAAGRFVRRTQINRSALECLQPVDIWLGSPEPLARMDAARRGRP